ncbi:MAG: protein kinase [Vulcanimicrobiota bacterium]
MQSGEAVTWKPGHVFDGKFEVKDLVGYGGMGAVFRVRHREWNLDLAVKMPLPEVVEERHNRERYIREAETWIDLGVYPHIVQCWFVRQFGGIPLLFLDYLAGGSLKDALETGWVRSGDWKTILDLTMQACDGLAYAHSRGVIHRDVKPANLLIRGDDRLCVTDFGIVKTTKVSELAAEFNVEPGALPEVLPEALKSLSMTLTGAGSLLGTPEYGAPEQWGNADKVGAQADVYALGVVLFEMCCGRRPFDDGKSDVPPSLLIGRHLSKKAPDPREFRPDLPEALAKLITKCLAKSPDERPATMAELRQRLSGVFQLVVGEAYKRPVPRPSEQRADALNNKGVSLWSLSKYSEAYAAWRKALEYDSGHCETIYNAAITRWRNGEISQDEVLRRLQQVKSNRGMALMYEGMFWLEAGDAVAAQTALTGALADPEVAEKGPAHRALGDALTYQAKYFVAEKAYKKALALMPDDGETVLRKRLATVGKRSYQGRIYFPEPTPAHEFRRAEPALWLAVGSSTSCFASDRHRCEGWDMAAGRGIWSREQQIEHPPSICCENQWLFSEGQLWSAQSGQTILELPPGRRFLAVDPQGRRALAGGTRLELLALPSGDPLVVYEEPTSAEQAIFTPDGERCLAIDASGRMVLRDAPTGDELQKLELGSAATALALIRRGAIALTGHSDGMVRVWDLARGQEIMQLAHSGRVLSLELGPEESYLLVHFQGASATWHSVWKLGGGKIREGEGGAALADEHSYVSWCQGQLCLTDLVNGRRIRTFQGLEGPPDALETTRARRYLTAITEGRLVAWEFDEQHRVYDRSLALSRGRTHAEAESGKARYQSELATAQKKLEEGDYSSAINRLALARRVAGYGRDPAALEVQAELTRRLPRKQLKAMWERRASTEAGRLTQGRLALAPKRLGVATAEGNRIKLWDFASGRLLQTLRGHDAPVELLEYSQTGAVLVSACHEPSLRVWKPDSGRCELLESPPPGLVDLKLSDDATILVGADAGGTLYHWDLVNRRLAGTIKTPSGSQQLLAVSKDAKLAVTGPDFFLWEVATGQPLLKPGHLRTDGRDDAAALRCTAAALGQGGAFAITAGADHVLRLWSTESGKCRLTLIGHTQPVRAMAMFSRLRFAVSADAGGHLHVWDLDTGHTMEVLKSHQVGLSGFVPDHEGRFYLTCGEDEAVRLWEMEWELDPEAEQITLADVYRPTGALGRLSSLFRRR